MKRTLQKSVGMRGFGILLTCLGAPATCLAQLPDVYPSLRATQKQEILWKNILRSEYDYANLPVEDSYIPSPDLLNPFYLLDSFTNTSDELSIGRKKLIHAYGSAAKVSVKITNPKYAGIFKSGGEGIARFSIARMINAKTTFTPGLAIKILVDGKPSINLHLMNSVDGQGSNGDFFYSAFSNILPEPTSFAGKILGKSFGIAVNLLTGILGGKGPAGPNHLPLLQACQLQAESSLCPSQIVLRPLSGFSDQVLEDDFRKDLAKIEPGSVLYDIAAIDASGQHDEIIGTLVTESRIVASAYGDRKLFFSHASLGR